MHVIPNIVIWSINGNTTESSIAANALILIWALRMAFYNIARHKKEDWRFAQMREEWE
jgi:steroid 5-alpha reductase family enzyme